MQRRHRAIAFSTLVAVLVALVIGCNTILGAELGSLRAEDAGRPDTSTAADAGAATDTSTGTVKPVEDSAVPKLAFGTIGGMVSNLTGKGLILKNNSADDLQVTADGAFTFPAKVASGSQYSVTVSSQPSNPTQTCVVTKGAGSVDGANVTDIVVDCATAAYTVAGTVVGLTGTGLALINNGTETLPIAAGGAFQFTTKLASGAAFSVAIRTQPTTGGPCNVSGGTGTVGGSDVSGVVVNCTAGTYTLGGNVTGLNGTVSLRNGAAGPGLSISSNGAFAFPQTLANGTPYSVTVLTQPTYPPSSQTCAVTSGSGTMGTANVSNIAVACTTNAFAIGGTLTGLSGSIVLKNNGGDALTLAASGPFTFGGKIAAGSTYAITIGTQPVGQVCSITNGTGTVGNGPITNVSATCSSVSAATVSINSKPPDPSNAAAWTFGFTTDGAVGSPQCKLDRPGVPGTFAACETATTHTVQNLTDGTHSFTVQVQNAGGIMGSAIYTWNVDRTAPVITLGSTPPNPTTSTQWTFTYVITGAIGIALCKVDPPGGAVGSFVSCGSNTQRLVQTPTAGTYTATIRASDGLNITDVSYTWTVIVAAPIALATWTLNGTIDSTLPFAVTTTAPGITAGALTRGPKLTPVLFVNAFVADGWEGADPTYDVDRYFEFSIGSTTAQIKYDSVRFSLYNNYPGAGSWQLRCDVDQYANPLAKDTYVTGIAGGGVAINADVSPIGTRAGTVTFRFYSYDNTGATSPFQRGFRGSAGGGTDLKIFGN